MERIENVNEEELNTLIEKEQANAQSEMWGDGDLTARIDAQGFETTNPTGILCDRRMREVIAYYQDPSSAWLPTRLKANDHVMLIGAVAAVVAMPARGRDSILVYAPETYGPQLVTITSSSVTDRAPLDPEEDPMPINAPWPLTAPEGDVTITTTIASQEHGATLTTTIDEEGIHTHVSATDPPPEEPTP